MTPQDRLVHALSRKQQDLSLTDAAFAQRLGVDRETWRKIRTGQIQPGRRTLRGVRRAFPDLIPEMLDFFLPDDARIFSARASQRAEVP